jgi:hypothetical protein
MDAGLVVDRRQAVQQVSCHARNGHVSGMELAEQEKACWFECLHARIERAPFWNIFIR